ncbi:MAG TPA: hypothetical protein VF395_03010, partial [Polyangiaceae bacterium]
MARNVKRAHARAAGSACLGEPADLEPEVQGAAGDDAAAGLAHPLFGCVRLGQHAMLVAMEGQDPRIDFERELRFA